jgi:ElaA protein
VLRLFIFASSLLRKMQWTLKKFDQLSVHELYDLLRLRTEVFVVEQNCVFQDMDNKDQLSWHLLGHEGDRLIACTRLVPPGVAYEYPSIGRVATDRSIRGTGIGRLLMEKSIAESERLFGLTRIKIGAQVYLKKFYTSLGFIQTGEPYLEDGIEHIEMIR